MSELSEQVRVPDDPVRAGPAAVPGRPRLAFAYPDGHQALHGVDLRVEPGERVALLGPNGAGKTTLVLHLNGILRAGAGTVERRRAAGGSAATLREIRRRVGIVFQDPDDQLFMPTVGEDVAFGPANLGVHGAELRGPGRRGARRRRHDRAPRPLPAPPVLRAAPPGRGRHRARDAARRSWCSTSPRPTWTRPPAASWPRCCSALAHQLLMVTHDLPYALELCPRASSSTTA